MSVKHRRRFSAAMAVFFAVVFVALVQMTPPAWLLLVWGAALNYRCMMYWSADA